MSEHEGLEKSLTGYKEKINPIVKGTLEWQKDLIFVGRTNEGYEIEFDAKVQWGCKPTDALLLSIAGCMGIDTVMFLQKMKVELASFMIRLSAERNPDPPQYFKKLDITVIVGGKHVDENKVKKAVNLSHEKYCSVYHSLRKDIVVNIDYKIEEKEPEKKEA
ncbi:MAG: OsmC family protein [Thermodesulfovibrionales bacterium]|nr:OsmC family protein [Thermodesulfovibrionales bacterium]